MSDLDLTEAIASGARVLAMLKPGEAWPTNAELGGNLTGTRDDEFYRAMHEEAAEVIEAALPFIVAQVRAQIAEDIEALDGEPLLKGLVSINRSAQAALEWAAATARGES